MIVKVMPHCVVRAPPAGPSGVSMPATRDWAKAPHHIRWWGHPAPERACLIISRARGPAATNGGVQGCARGGPRVQSLPDSHPPVAPASTKSLLPGGQTRRHPDAGPGSIEGVGQFLAVPSSQCAARAAKDKREELELGANCSDVAGK